MANKQSLRLLADGLKKLPVNYDGFDMDTFFTDHEGDQPGTVPRYISEEINVCGTSACAVGHGPTIPGLEAYPTETWTTYTTRVFGVGRFDDAFGYMFGARWSSIDNSVEGAIERIETYLASGIPQSYYNETED